MNSSLGFWWPDLLGTELWDICLPALLGHNGIMHWQIILLENILFPAAMSSIQGLTASFSTPLFSLASILWDLMDLYGFWSTRSCMAAMMLPLLLCVLLSELNSSNTPPAQIKSS
jgi:hypothetical protein